MPHQGGGGGSVMTSGSVFFWCLWGQILMVEDYAYSRTDFRGDINLPLPKDDQLDDKGEKDATFIVFFIL